jgi:ribosomal protein L29
MRHVLLVIAIVASVRGTSHANCAPTPSQEVRIVVDKCVAVAKAKGSILLDGKDDTDTAIEVWVPPSENASCAMIKPGATVIGSLGLACCDGDTSPPCTLGTSQVMTTIIVLKSVKQETRAELEAEVTALRAETFRLRVTMELENVRLRKEADRLRKQLK